MFFSYKHRSRVYFNNFNLNLRPEPKKEDQTKEFEELLKVFEKFNYYAHLIGARALILYGLFHRTTKDVHIMVPVNDIKELRGKITEALRDQGFNVQWRSWDLQVKTSSGYGIDVNRPLLIYHREFHEHSKRIHCNLYLLSIEDLIVTKLMALGHRDYEDLEDALGKVEKIDYNRLCKRVREAGLLKEFNKLAKRPSYTITTNKPNTGVNLEHMG